MISRIAIHRETFGDTPRDVFNSSHWQVWAKKYPSGVESLTVQSSRLRVEILPYLGGMLWDAEADGVSLRMKNMFTQPHPVATIQDTYGCFAFHSGLLANGCPSPEDKHPLHGEFPCAPMNRAQLVIHENGTLSVESQYEYVQGFGYHYTAVSSVTFTPDSGRFDIGLAVTNRSTYQRMPLQYMCHMNYAFVPGGTMHDNLDANAFKLRESVPAHVTPTPQWEEINRKILAGEYKADSLEGAEAFDPEIVYFADHLTEKVKDAQFTLTRPDGTAFYTSFATEEFPVATRWILHNPDQSVAAFALPGTSRPEGYLAAQKAGTLIELAPGETRHFTVTTGLLNEEEAQRITL
ncbi:aldose 1-epimerase family protein [Rothia sp. ZJ932]|uniref:aldose 1-epimerase family protein n=1 Tax=Rothia sp. ZJ932 TaxID=2810516 RepID=UPI001966D27B|nr:aldose 1-epimerase family protein [Rothia sp. ZJ932]QRZ61274.1 aldose 1-epimerase family protein [Rothia sp. ZJ932]